MKVLFLTTAHNTMSQRAYVELTERGHEISVELAISDKHMIEAVALYSPDLIVAPMLKKAIPEQIWRTHTCIIIHPGIEGDRGPSSLDWAILEGESEWGVTLLQANAEMDAGELWSVQTFPMRPASKSQIYRNEVIEAAMCGLVETVERFESGTFKPRPAGAGGPGVRGRLRPSMKQQDRAFDWSEPTAAIARKIRSGDGTPGVITHLAGGEYYLFGACEEDTLRGGPPGRVIARRHGAVCIATGDGALWVSHCRPKRPGERTLKLPAAVVLDGKLDGVAEAPLSMVERPPGRTHREIWYESEMDVTYLHFDFYNGAMSATQCERLLDAFMRARAEAPRVLVLMGGEDYFSNGIDLNVIEAASSPAEESWRNIVAMNDLVREILQTDSCLVIAAMQGAAGAGGVMMALSADYVFARSGVVLNPHYKSMGLFGSEYWTYTLPRRVGKSKAEELTEACLPIGTAAARRIGLIDDAFGTDPASFRQQLRPRAQKLAQHPEHAHFLDQKRARLARDFDEKPIEAYHAEELVRMCMNFFDADSSYPGARQSFVYKAAPADTPQRFALHRRPNKPT